MKAFLADFSGICNFNYKLRTEGGMCIFEVNARIGADLACDATRSRAAQVRA
jgi:carbamoylphosphate synthase large subunit